MTHETLPEAAERLIRAWPQWSRAERAGMGKVVAEVLAHLRDGTGNRFIRGYCDRVLLPALRTEGRDV